MKSLYKKIIYAIIVITSIFSFFTFYEVADNHSLAGYIYDNYIHFNRRIVVREKVKNVELEEFQLFAADSVFFDIHNEYFIGLSRKGAERSWKTHSAKLVYKNDTFNVKIKGHGISPVRHTNMFGKYSIRVILKPGQEIFGYRKFSFVVLERTLNRNMVLSKFSELLNLYFKPSYLVKLSINNSEFYPYNLEPSNKNFCKNNLLRYEKINKNKKGPIGFFSNEKTIFKKRYKAPHEMSDYIKLKIINSAADSIAFVHRSYYAKYLAICLVLRFNGHGMSNESNFMVHSDLYDWVPVIHRDNIPQYVRNDKSKNIKEYFKEQLSEISQLYGEEYFLSQLFNYPTFLQELRKEVEYIVNHYTDIEDEIIESNKKYEQLLGGGFLDIHFNWRDESQLPEAYRSTFVDINLIEGNLNFWAKKINNNYYWKVN